MPLPAIIGGALAVVIVSLVVRVLTALGIGIITYTGMDYVLTQATNYFNDQFSGLPAAAVQILYMVGFHQGVSMVLAAYSAALAIKVATGSFVKFSLTGS